MRAPYSLYRYLKPTEEPETKKNKKETMRVFSSPPKYYRYYR